MIAGKAWGETEQILANPSVEFHRIRVKRGKKCSEHKHQSKWNGFYVVKGSLSVRVWKNDYDLIDVTTIGPGQFMQVKPGEYHQFEALEDTDAFELYWAGLDGADIQRRG